MSTIADSKCSNRGDSMSVKWPALLAAGTIASLAASQAHAEIAYTPLSLIIDSSGAQGPTSTTITMPNVGSTTTDNKLLFTFTASTTNGLTMGKPAPISSTNDVLGQLVGVTANTSSGATTFPTAYTAGTPIYPGSPPSIGYSVVATTSSKNLTLLSANGSSGNFTEAAGQEYIGFTINGTAAYQACWVSFETLGDTADYAGAPVVGEITGVSYQTDTAIPLAAGAVPEPASLGLLAMGSVGLLNYRRRKPQK